MISAGTVIDGNYRVEATIGEGSFGVVYRSFDLGLGRMVALKMLNPDKSSDRDLRKFVAEGRHLAIIWVTSKAAPTSSWSCWKAKLFERSLMGLGCHCARTSRSCGRSRPA